MGFQAVKPQVSAAAGGDCVEHARVDRTVGDQLVPALLWDDDKALVQGLLVM